MTDYKTTQDRMGYDNKDEPDPVWLPWALMITGALLTLWGVCEVVGPGTIIRYFESV